MTACSEATSEVVAELLEQKVDVKQKDEKNRNCMFYVLENKKKQQALQIMTVLLDKHPELRDSTASLNISILMSALEKNKLELVKLLLERGADPNQASSDLSTSRVIRRGNATAFSSAHTQQTYRRKELPAHHTAIADVQGRPEPQERQGEYSIGGGSKVERFSAVLDRVHQRR